jgi:hypothetical protein
MAQLISEAKRFQKLAGIIKEENASYTIHLKIDGKTVMSRTSDSNFDEKEMSDNLTALESKYKDKYDFDKAEIVVLDPSGKQVGSLTKKNQRYTQWPFTGGSNFGGGGQGSLGGL